MEDRRLFARVETKFPMRFLDPGSGAEGEAQIMDISANGIGFITERRLPANTELEMWLDIPDHHSPFYTRGAVAWSRDLGDNGQRVGMHLEKAEFMGLGRALWMKRKDKDGI